MILSRVHVLVIILFSSVGQVQLSRDEIPNIFFQINPSGDQLFQRGWFVIKSKQVTNVVQQKPTEVDQNNEWTVEEYFSFEGGISYSVHSNVLTRDTYTLLAHSGRIYFSAKNALTGAVSCKLDHRLDYSTLFPWRYSSTRRQSSPRNKQTVPKLVIGVGALWLNAIEQHAECSTSNVNFIGCELQDSQHKVHLTLKYALESGKLSQLRSARVSRLQAIHLEFGATIMQDIVVDVEVDSVLVLESLQEDTKSKIYKLIDVCQKATGDMDALFPSLMRSLVESNQRSYYFSYLVKVYDWKQEQEQVIGDYSVQEWFSYQLGQQTIAHRDRANNLAEKYYAKFKYRPRDQPSRAACFKVSQYDTCSLTEEIDDPFRWLSRLSQRHMDLVTHSSIGGIQRRKYSVRLVGLGALLMNAADSQDKQEFANDVTRNNKWLSSVEWLIEDRDAGLQIHFYFRRRAYAEHNNDCDVDDLIRVEFRKLAESSSADNKNRTQILGGLDSDQRPVARYSDHLVLSVELLEYNRFFYQDELDNAYKLPKICDQALAQADLVDREERHNDESATQHPETSSVQPSTSDSQDDRAESYEFPEFEQFLNLERDYIISSEWNYDNGTRIKLVEYLMLDDDQEKEDRQLFSRLDVSRSSETEQFRMSKVYVRYASSTALHIENSVCKQVNTLEDWLELLSIDPIECYGIEVDQELNANVRQPRLYGVGALWKLASRSPFVRYLSSDEAYADDAVKYAEWQLVDHPGLPDVSVVFKFKVGPSEAHAELWRRLTLEELNIDVSKLDVFKPVQSVKIEKIELKTGEANALHFILPPSCDPNLDRHYAAPLPKFPSFVETFHAPPKRATFSLDYNLVVTFDETTRSLDVLEVSKGPSGLGQIVLDEGNQNSIFWLLTNSGRALMQHSSIGTLCKEIQGGLSHFFGIQASEQLISGGNDELISESSSFLIANLWHMLSRRIDFESNLDVRIETGAQVVVKRRYILGKLNRHLRLIEWSLKNGGHGSLAFTFEHSHMDNKLSLYSVTLETPDRVHMRFMLDHVGHVASFETQASAGIPAECYNRLSIQSDQKFPKLLTAIESRNSLINLAGDPPHMHMRATLTTNILDNSNTAEQLDDDRYFLTDEYYLTGNQAKNSNRYRLKSISFTKNLDYLIFEETEEFFDLSIKQKCISEPPFARKEAAGNERIDWIGENLLAISLDGIAFYGPLNLWRLSDMPETKKSEIDVNQLDLITFFQQDLLDDWFLVENWQIEVRLSNGVSLSYKMRFNKEFDMKANQWHTALDSIVLEDDQRKILVDVVDYNHNFGSIHLEELRIPKGFGCKRNKLFKERPEGCSRDFVVIESLSPISFNYKASLELFDPQSGRYEPQPVFHSGWLGRCPKFWNLVPIGPLKVNHLRSHFLNGTSIATKQVITSNEGLVDQSRVLNEQTGVCSIEARTGIPNEILRLDFSSCSATDMGQSCKMDSLVITDGALGLLTNRMSDFELIQYDEGPEFANQITNFVYELRVGEFKLSPNLAGPASIIRTFERKPTTKDYGDYYYHSDIKIEAIVLDKARFSLQLENLAFMECTSILKRASTEDCHQSSALETISKRGLPFHQPPARLRNFVMRFHVTSDLFNKNQFEAMKPRIEVSFIETLLKLPSGLRSMQLGQMRSSYHDREQTSVEIFVNLLESPSSIEYFVKIPGKTTFDSSNGFPASTKLLNSKYSCSIWCDSLDCIAFTYCYGSQSCKVITTNMPPQEETKTNEVDPQSFFTNLLHDDGSCDFYYAPASRKRDTLSKTVEFIRTHLGSLEESEKIQFAFYTSSDPTERIVFEAVEFEELTGDVESINEQALGAGQTMDDQAHQVAFTPLKVDEVLEYSDLQQIEGVEAKLTQAESRVDCQANCQNCQLYSFCDRNCITVEKITSWQTFKQSAGLSRSRKGCSVWAEDYALDYHEFPGTWPPENSAAREDGLTLTECAAMCDLQIGSLDCLSFDFCINSTNHATCYLQTMHVLMDDFDESILSGNRQAGSIKDNSSTGGMSKCSHYSKSLLSDFDRIPGKKYTQHKSLVFQGTPLDTCALICRRDDTCSAFEHCYNAKAKISNLCYIQRAPDEGELTGMGFEIGPEVELLEDSNECQIYKLRHVEEEFEIAKSNKGESILQSFRPDAMEFWSNAAYRLSWLINGIILIGCLFAAMVIGSIVQIMCIVVTGHTIPVSIKRDVQT